MRILQVTPGYYPVIGGVEKHVQALSEQLAGQGHEVVVATMQPRGRQLPDEEHGSVKIVRFDAWGVGDAYRIPHRGLLTFLDRTWNDGNGWDIVHVHNYHAALIPLVAARAPAGKPFVVTTHLNDTPHSAAANLLHVPYALVGRWAVNRASAVICVTQAERERIATRLGVPQERSVVIPNGVTEELARVGQDVQEHDPCLVLAVGRLQAYKRVEDAIGALGQLDESFRLVVVGEGPERQRLEQLAASQGVAGRVTFAGKASDGALLDWYRQAGVVVALSEAEAFGMTVLEGVAAGCQVVCNDIPAFRDLAGHFPEHVTVAEGRNAEAVAGAISQAAARRTEPADVSGWTWAAVAGRTAEVYEQVITGSHA